MRGLLSLEPPVWIPRAFCLIQDPEPIRLASVIVRICWGEIFPSRSWRTSAGSCRSCLVRNTLMMTDWGVSTFIFPGSTTVKTVLITCVDLGFRCGTRAVNRPEWQQLITFRVLVPRLRWKSKNATQRSCHCTRLVRCYPDRRIA